MKKITVLFVFLLSLISCQEAEEVREITVADRYAITIPAFLTKARNLNDDASLQYQHLRKEFYVIVIDEPKADVWKVVGENDPEENYPHDLDGYAQLHLQSMENGLSDAKLSEIETAEVNDMPARIATVSGEYNNVHIYYSRSFIEGKDRYYQVVVWTLSHKKQQYKNMMNKIHYSLKEIS